MSLRTFQTLVFEIVNPRIGALDHAIGLRPSIMPTESTLSRVVVVDCGAAVEALFIQTVLLAISTALNVRK